jgi:hypothetical protein
MSERPRCDDVLCSSVSDVRLLLIEVGAAESMPAVDGVVMVRGTPLPCSIADRSTADGELRAGRRYVDVVSGLTLLCIRPGRGVLCYQGRRLRLERSVRREWPSAAATQDLQSAQEVTRA